MRILYHHRTRAEDGQAVHVRALIRAFETLGHEVHESGLVRHVERPWAVKEERKSGWGWVAALPRFALELAELGYSGVARRRLIGEAARFGAELLYERYAFGNMAGLLAARRSRIPFVLEVNSPMVLELRRTRGLSFPRLAERVERMVFEGADRICAVSGVLKGMIAEMGVPGERIAVTPNGVDLASFEYGDREAARSRARSELDLPGDAPVLGFVGYFRSWHRLDVVLEALAAPALGEALLVLVGGGPAGDELRRRAAELGIAGRVRFAGSRPYERIPELLPAFDVAVLPAINAYASPLKLHEYMAAGLAVIAPDQPNLREVLSPGENGLLVAPGDVAAFEEAARRLVEDAGLRARLGEAARRTIVERDLTWEANARSVVAMAAGLRSGEVGR